MKRIISFLFLIFIGLFLTSCGLPFFVTTINHEKDEIVLEKFGNLNYIVERIIVYKNLSDEFKNIEDIETILKNQGARGSVEPSFRENFFLYMDIVEQNFEYKLLVYDVVMKKGRDKSSMFVLTDYFLPISIETITDILNNYDGDQNINDFRVSYIKKDSNIEKPQFHQNDISISYYNKIHEGDILLSFHDESTGNVIIGNNYNYVFGNYKEKEIYYPEYIKYGDYIYGKYDTLNDEMVEFSLDKGETFNIVDEALKEFDIWNKLINSEVPNHEFFYAWDYDEFLIKIEETKNHINQPEEYSRQDFNYLKEMFNEEYFSENILIYYYKYEPNISKNYVYSLTKNENILTVNINRFDGMDTAFSFWEEFITVKKINLEGINKIDLIVRTISKK